MDIYRAILAIVLSVLVLLGYQLLVVGPPAEQPAETPVTDREAPPAEAVDTGTPEKEKQAITVPDAGRLRTEPRPPAAKGRDLLIDTSLYRAVLTETGGGFKSFTLKEYRETIQPDSPPKELVKTDEVLDLPTVFAWGPTPGQAEIPVYTADNTALRTTDTRQSQTLTMTAHLDSGLGIVRTLEIDHQSYLIKMSVEVFNQTDQPLQGAPYFYLTNRPFSEEGSNRYLFTGPALLLDNELQEIKPDDLEEGSKAFSGNISWTAYEGNYFTCGVIPEQESRSTVNLTAEGKKVTTALTQAAALLPAGESVRYDYTLYFGPKKLSILKGIGNDLDRIVNFGWFDVVAKPALYLLNFFYGFVGNYGVAIILVTVLFKILFWPIAQRGMKSMKNMQALQPKMAKLREKHKNDPTRLNQEMMNLYKAYKVNPLGGCLPMLLQIPVFFALYKVLLQAIELRHAPFMLWINDLSAPDRLPVGFDIPLLGGIPVLTLLMGASMFFQQKMTPTPADPTQAKIMMFLPVIFTFLFINFASGLVLYWFVNNLLAIFQQYLINRPAPAGSPS